MKKTVTVEIDICDFCKEKEAHKWRKCLECGKVFCYYCEPNNIVSLKNEYYNGIKSIHFCKDCIESFKNGKTNELYNLGNKLEKLVQEQIEFNNEIENRGDEIENQIGKLLKKI